MTFTILNPNAQVTPLTIVKKHLALILVFFLFTHSQKLVAQSAWSLRQCIDTTLKNNLTIQQSVNTLDLNEITLSQSKSNRLPTLNGSASESFNTGRSVNPVSNQFTTGQTFSNSFSLNSSVTLFNGLQNFNTIKQSQANYLASKCDLEAVKNDITLNIVNAYLQALFSGELLRIAQNQLDGTKQQLEKTLQLVEVGKKSEGDALQIKSQFATDKLSLINAQNQLKTNKLSLQQLMNVTVSSNFEIYQPSDIDPQINELNNITETYTQALSLQPVIKSYGFKIMSSEYAIKIARGALLPRLALNGNIYTNYSSASKINNVTYLNTVQPIGYLQSNSSELVLGNSTLPIYNSTNYLFSDQVKNNFSQTISLSLTVPIFNNFSVRNNIRKQMINLKNTKLNEQIAQNNLRKNIEQAYTDAQNALEKYFATKEQVAATSASSQNSNVRYENGMITASDFLLEKNKYLKAQSDQIQAKYELIFRLKIIDFYKGTTLNL